jgi:hypothetical protein
MRKRACTDLRGGAISDGRPYRDTDRLCPDKRDAFNSSMQDHLIDMMFRDGVWLNTSLKLREQRLGHSDAPILAAL